MGHPASRKDLVQDFNDLLEGKAITGEGTTVGGGDDEEGEGAFKKNVEADACEGAVTKFLADSTTHLLTESTKEAATGMPRAFCVLVHESRYDCKTNTLENNMKNYHVLVGSQDKIDAMKVILKPFNEGPWEVVLREQAT
jgi:hypothetical protein